MSRAERGDVALPSGNALGEQWGVRRKVLKSAAAVPLATFKIPAIELGYFERLLKTLHGHCGCESAQSRECLDIVTLTSSSSIHWRADSASNICVME